MRWPLLKAAPHILETLEFGAGTPVNCACGDGVIDWARVIQLCRRAKRDLVLSVECGTIEQAERSIKHLKKLLK